MNTITQLQKILKIKKSFTPEESDTLFNPQPPESAFRTVCIYRNIHTGEESEFSHDWHHADWRLVGIHKVLKHR